MKVYQKFIAITLLSSILIAIIWLIYYLMKKAKTNQPEQIPITKKGGFNNPGNLINTSIKWGGEVNSDIDKTFEDFISMEMGIRAWLLNLEHIIKKNDGVITVDKMIDILTPGGQGTGNSELARNNYKAFVKDKIGTDKVSMDNINKVAHAVFLFEANPTYMKNPLSINDISLIQLKYNIV